MPVEVKSDDFMCRCSDEGAAMCDAVLAYARELVSKRSDLQDDLDFVDRMLFWLAVDGDISIGADQWAGIYVKPFAMDPLPEHVKVREPVRIQCDRITDGLAAAVVFYFGDES